MHTARQKQKTAKALVYDRRMYAMLRLKMHATSHADKNFAFERHELFFTLTTSIASVAV
jgi:hypothetical protein